MPREGSGSCQQAERAAQGQRWQRVVAGRRLPCRHLDQGKLWGIASSLHPWQSLRAELAREHTPKPGQRLERKRQTLKR